MVDDGRVVTAKLPDDLVSRMDEIADRIDRSKSWIVRQAVAEWLAEEQRRHELTLEALKDVDPDVRSAGLQALGKFQEKRKKEYAELSERLRLQYENAVRMQKERRELGKQRI